MKHIHIPSFQDEKRSNIVSCNQHKPTRLCVWREGIAGEGHNALSGDTIFLASDTVLTTIKASQCIALEVRAGELYIL